MSSFGVNTERLGCFPLPNESEHQNGSGVPPFVWALKEAGPGTQPTKL